jgi:DNA polymerase IV
MIVHFDLDAFYASVEQRDDPSLRGVPLAVSGSSRRAVVLTASYEARPYGVRSAMPLYRALHLCPQLVAIRPTFTKYRAASQAVFAIFEEGGNVVEGLSLDEAYVGLPGADVATARAFTETVRARIRAEVGLTASAGISAVKMVAKIASDMHKPDGMTIVEPGTERTFLAPLPVGRLWGIGPKTLPRIEAAGIATIGDVAALDTERLYQIFGRAGLFFRDLARGIDEREVDGSRERKSISTEETFEYDERDEAVVLDLLRRQADELAEDLQAKHLRGSTVGIKVKRADFTVTGRQTTLAAPTNDAATILAASTACWTRAAMTGIPIRLLGTRIAALTEELEREMRLF